MDTTYYLDLPSAGSIRVMRTNRLTSDGRRVFAYVVRHPGGGIVHTGADLFGPADGTTPSVHEMTGTLLSHLVAGTAAYARNGTDGTGTWPADVMEWAYQHSEALSLAALEIEEGRR